ncbi:Hypothetical predicted protein [Paramuricea clavata]|uniref:Uncharacterized protein n=1 Tax=Paramuricea clavata TaxID=317549 RepID=A0A7D9LVK4_PARCT|nr:Hypothetical predicted protein [Paramuricea clavata]
MNVKIKDLNNEKNSLITVIKILQEDQHNEQPWSVETKQKKIQRQSIPPTDKTSNNGEPLRSNNRYSILSDTDNEHKVVITSQVSKPLDRDNLKQHNNKNQARHNAKQPSEEEKRMNEYAQTKRTEPKSQQSDQERCDRHDSQFNKPRVAILGDPMLKHLNIKRMQNGLSKQKINIKTFPGAGIDQMKHVVPTLNTTPDKLIHIGTNDLHNKTPDNQLKSINNLGQTITQQNKDNH